MEELVLVIDKDFIREQDGKGITRIKWFLHSLEQMEMIGRVERNLQSQHVGGDVVRCSMLFNTVRKDSREREYHVSEAGYSIIMSRLGSVLEAAAQAGCETDFFGTERLTKNYTRLGMGSFINCQLH